MNQIPFKVRGMQKDLAESIFNPQYAYDIMNMRIMATNDNTLMSLVNEKGPKQLTIKWDDDPSIAESSTDTFEGTPVGQASIGDYYILFTTKASDGVNPKKDYIYKFWFTKGDLNEDILNGRTLFPRGESANLGFDATHPIETLVYYENESIQKVYWVDGINQTRLINIAADTINGVFDNSIINTWTNESFDFVVNLKLKEAVSVSKSTYSNGVFSSGVIQYALTYFNKFGQESNIFHTTPLNYISFNDRGASPEEGVSNSFDITVSNVDQNFDYIRIYSIYRTSVNGTPVVKRLVDIELKDQISVNYIDNGIYGDIIDPRLLLYIGGEKVIAGTLNQKDNTLFLGNLKIERSIIEDDIKNQLKTNSTITYDHKPIVYQPDSIGNYPYTNTLNYSNPQITTFKSGEWYRFGVIFQHKTGKWSEVVWLGDKQNTFGPTVDTVQLKNNNLIKGNVSINNTNNALTNLLNKGYVRAKGVVVYPTIADRTVLCQGILNPTVYNVKDRFSNSPFAQSSWFTRPMIENDKLGSNELEANIPYGAWAEFRHDNQIPASSKRNAEIQNISDEVTPYVTGSDTSSWVNNNKHRYYIDQSIVTLHSPDIEFDDQLKSIDLSNMNLRIVGVVPITATQKDIDVQASSVSNKSTLNPFYNEFIDSLNTSNMGIRGIVSGAIWHDRLYKPTTPDLKLYGFVVYPWHRNGSLTNASNPTDNEVLPAMLTKKKMSNLRFSAYTDYCSSLQRWSPLNGIKPPVIFDSNEVSLVKVKAPVSSGKSELYYYGNIDTISFNPIQYPIKFTKSTTGSSPDLFRREYQNVDNTNVKYSNDPIRIKYKSTPHAVITFNDVNNKPLIMPKWSADMNTPPPISPYERPFWQRFPTNPNPPNIIELQFYSSETPSSGVYEGDLWFDTSFNQLNKSVMNGDNQEWVVVGSQDVTVGNVYYYRNLSTGLTTYVTVATAPVPGFPTFTISAPTTNNNVQQDTFGGALTATRNFGGLYLAELYRDNVTNRFGGETETAFNNNIWVPAGPSVDINTEGTTLVYNQGDTYFQRYDHLKTYPFTMEDQNSIVDIVSFMCETRVNIDGRYDRNRGNKNNLSINPTIFNLLNPVYNQTDNFFTYRPLSSTISTESIFPNAITWSLTKSSASLTDAWTNITLASVLDLDGDKGQVNVIKRFNNELIAFQNKGISNILFNSRTQISGTDGVPIEIANSGKVDGKRYITDKVGCQNKWSIVESPMGLYFMDDIGKSILLFNGQVQDISDEYGFHSWINDRSKEVNIWNPSAFDQVVGYYDKVNGEVLFISKDECLAFSEPLKAFTSFYSYNNTPYFMNIKDKGVWVNKSRSLQGGASSNYALWEHNAGEYNRYFDKSEDFYVTVIANAEPSRDKIFNVVEFRSDSFDLTDTYLPNDTFDKLETWNEYQHGVQSLSDSKNRPSALKKKFRMWRANIPRDYSNGRSRMRNPWLFVKLSKQGTLCHHKTILHDLNVQYTV